MILMMAFAVLGLMPSADTGGIPRGDLIAHLGGWIIGALSGRVAYPRLRATGLGLGLWIYSLLIELAQMAVPTRSFELLDLVANATGIVLGLLLWTTGARRWGGRDGGT